MVLNTYLTFDGNCQEAFEFYRSVFGGEFIDFTTFGEGPEGLPLAEGQENQVMHVALPVGDSILMGSDSTTFGPPVAVGNNFSISVDADSREQADELIAALSDGGAVTLAMEDQFWGAYFGMCVDRFGVNWMLVYDASREQTADADE